MSDLLRDPIGGTGLADYVPLSSVGRTDEERWPTLTAEGYRRLTAWRTHAHAPVWVHECGDLLTRDDHDRLRRMAKALEAHQHETPPSAPSPWVAALVERSAAHTGFYRRLGLRTFEELPLVSRSDLAAGVADFMPRDVPLDRVVQGTSSGSTGAALVLPLDPLVIAADLVLLEHLLTAAGVAWRPDPTRFGLLSVVDQQQAFTYASILTLRGEQPMARVNLAETAWRRSGDREAFLTSTRTQVVTGTALSLLRLARLPGLDGFQPLALVSGAVALTPAARRELTERFGVPVLDLYGLKETGPIAVSPDGGLHRVVPRHLYLEAVDPRGEPVPDGTRGELVVTSDENPHLPLLRYRTGDHGVLGWVGANRTIAGLEGRAPVRFRSSEGTWVPSVELTQQLQHHGAVAWSVHQAAGGEVTASVALAAGADAGPLRRALAALLGEIVTVEPTALADRGPGTPRTYASECTEEDR